MSAAPPPIPSKQNFLEEMLKAFPIVCVHFVPGRGAALPPHLASRKTCMLEYGLNQPVPIPDLALARDGIVATLSFNREPFRTFVPWEAIFFIENPDRTAGYVWQDDIPKKGDIATSVLGLDPEPDARLRAVPACNDTRPPRARKPDLQPLLSPPRASLWVADKQCDHLRTSVMVGEPGDAENVLIDGHLLPCATPGCEAGPTPEPAYPGLAAFGATLRRRWDPDMPGGWSWEAYKC